jgi:hypothetical protein
MHLFKRRNILTTKLSNRLHDNIYGPALPGKDERRNNFGRVYTMTLRQIYRSVVICIRSAKRSGP